MGYFTPWIESTLTFPLPGRHALRTGLLRQVMWPVQEWTRGKEPSRIPPSILRRVTFSFPESPGFENATRESHPFGIIFKWLTFEYQYSADFPISHSFRSSPACPPTPSEMTQDDSEGQWAQVCVEGEGGITVVQLYNGFWEANKPVLVPITSPGKGTWVWVQVLLSTSDLGF